MSLVLPADAYQQVERSVKYAVLFIGLTFGTFFLLELLSPERLHAVHYVLVGFALCLFYVLLLALAEHLGFVAAYGIAALATDPDVARHSGHALSTWQLHRIYGFVDADGREPDWGAHAEGEAFAADQRASHQRFLAALSVGQTPRGPR